MKVRADARWSTAFVAGRAFNRVQVVEIGEGTLDAAALEEIVGSELLEVEEIKDKTPQRKGAKAQGEEGVDDAADV